MEAESSSKGRYKNTGGRVKSCAECRRLKLRCDRTVPCLNCVRKGKGVICPSGTLKPSRGRTLILDSNEELHDRIASLETALRQATGDVGGHPLLSGAYHLGSPKDYHRSGEQSGTWEHHELGKLEEGVKSGRKRVRRSSSRASSQNSQQSRSSEFNSTPFGSVGKSAGQEENRHVHLLTSEENPANIEFFGDASSLFLARSQTVHAEKAQSELPIQQGWVESFLLEPPSTVYFEHAINAMLTSLPPREESERLAALYFENVAWGVGIVERASFVPDFVEPAYSGVVPGPQQLAVLAFVLALGSLFDPAWPLGADNNPISRKMFLIGRSCLAFDSSGSMTFVQAVFLAVTWLANGSNVQSATQSIWQLLGMGMRAVQALGLHRDGVHFNLPAADVAKRRLVFWEIYAYDVFFSVGLARPRSMSRVDYDVQFPAVRDENDLYHDFRYRCADSVFAKINDCQTSVSKPRYAKILDLHRHLQDFQQSLPEIPIDDVGPDTIPSRQSRVIQRYAREFRSTIGYIHLHRTWFVQALILDPDEPLQSRFCTSYVACLEACKSLLVTVRDLVRDAPFMTNRRWFFHLEAFTACICLAASVIRAPRSTLAKSSFSALTDGIKLFQKANKATELGILSRLRDTASRRLTTLGRASPVSDEDLTLLGSASIGKLRVERELPRPALSVPSSRRKPAVDFSPSGSVQTETSSAAALMEEQSRAEDQSAPGRTDPGIALGSPVGNMMSGIELFDGGTDITNFDFDAFLATFGLDPGIMDVAGEVV